MQKIRSVVAQVARAHDRINLPEITSSFQHSLKKDGDKEKRHPRRTRPPPSLSSLTISITHPTPRRFLFSSPASCSLSVLAAFCPPFLRPPRKFLQFLSLLIYPPPRAFILLLSFRGTRRRNAMRRDATRRSRKELAVVLFVARAKFKPRHWIRRSLFRPLFSSRVRPALTVYFALYFFACFIDLEPVYQLRTRSSRDSFVQTHHFFRPSPRP